MFGHWLFDLKFGMFSWFGVGAASGVVLNDNLVLLDRMLKERGEGGHVDALVHAAVSRLADHADDDHNGCGIATHHAGNIQAEFLKLR